MNNNPSRNALLLETTTKEPNAALASSFPFLMQAGAVAIYVLSDTILRFLYQEVIVGNASMEEATASSSYDKPLALSFTCYTAFTLWGIPVALYVWWIRRESLAEYYAASWAGALGFRAALARCAPVVLLLTFQNYFYVAALRYIRVAISTAVGQSEAPFTVFLTVAALGRRLGKTESKGVVMSFTGIALIVLPPLFRIAAQDQQQQELDEYEDTVDSTVGGTLIGIVFTIMAAFFFSVYQIFWHDFDQRRFPDSIQQLPPKTPIDSIVDTMATIALVGICNIFVGPVLLLIAHVCRMETMELPPSSAMPAILASCFLSAFVDAMNGVACVVASAVVVAMAYPLTIPLSVLMEAVWSGIPLSAWGMWGWIGTAMVVTGIFFLENDDLDLECGCIDVHMEDDAEEAMSPRYLPSVN